MATPQEFDEKPGNVTPMRRELKFTEQEIATSQFDLYTKILPIEQIRICAQAGDRAAQCFLYRRGEWS